MTQNFLSQKEVIWLFRPDDLNDVRHRKRQGIEIIRLMEEERERRELGGQGEDMNDRKRKGKGEKRK